MSFRGLWKGRRLYCNKIKMLKIYFILSNPLMRWAKKKTIWLNYHSNFQKDVFREGWCLITWCLPLKGHSRVFCIAHIGGHHNGTEQSRFAPIFVPPYPIPLLPSSDLWPILAELTLSVSFPKATHSSQCASHHPQVSLLTPSLLCRIWTLVSQ